MYIIDKTKSSSSSFDFTSRHVLPQNQDVWIQALCQGGGKETVFLALTYRLTFDLTVHRHSQQSWKAQCETKRWAGNCLTFILAVKLKRWTKTSSP